MGKTYSEQDNQTEGSATFICCASEDRDFALKLAHDVGQPNVEMQLSPEEAPPAPAWNIVDEAPIRACRFFVVIVSPAAINSWQVRDQFLVARAADKSTVLVVRRSCRLPPPLQNLPCLDCSGRRYQAGLRQLRRHLLAQSPQPEIVSSPARSEKLWSWFNHPMKPRWLELVGLVLLVLTLVAGQRAVSEGIAASEPTKPYRKPAVPLEPTTNQTVEASVESGAGGVVWLWEIGRAESLRTLKGIRGYVTSVAFSPVLPDGAAGPVLASGSTDKKVRLWDASSGQLLHTLEGHTDWVLSVAFSSDGRLLASAGEDHTVRLWDASSGQLLRTLKGHIANINSVAFSPDGRLLASSSDYPDNTIRLWDPATGRMLRMLPGHTDDVIGIAFNPVPPGRDLHEYLLASVSADGTVRLWGVEEPF